MSGVKNLGLAAFLLLGYSASAEIKQQRGREVIDEAVAALGGKRFLAMRERVEAGTSYTSSDGERFSGPTPTKIYTTYLDGPRRPGELAVRERQSFGKGEYRSLVFADGAGSEITWQGQDRRSHPFLKVPGRGLRRDVALPDRARARRRSDLRNVLGCGDDSVVTTRFKVGGHSACEPTFKSASCG